MARKFSELPWLVQLLIYFAVAVVVFGLGEWLEMSPIKTASNEKDEKTRTLSQLKDEINKLQAVKQRHQDLLTLLQTTKDQLARMQTFVPEEKKTDDFMRLLQASSLNAQTSLRRLSAKAVVFKEFYAEMPFEIEIDGPYYASLEFFDRLGGSTRIINAAGLKLSGIETGGATRGKYEYTPGTTVAGVCLVTTYYIPAQAELAAVAPAAPGTRPAAGAPAPPPTAPPR